MRDQFKLSFQALHRIYAFVLPILPPALHPGTVHILLRKFHKEILIDKMIFSWSLSGVFKSVSAMGYHSFFHDFHHQDVVINHCEGSFSLCIVDIEVWLRLNQHVGKAIEATLGCYMKRGGILRTAWAIEIHEPLRFVGEK